MDRIDELVQILNTIEGIQFVRDAWVNKAPENYGVVELVRSQIQWADGKPINQTFTANIWLYVVGDDDGWGKKIQDKLVENDIGFSMPSRTFDYNVEKVCWQWVVSLYGL